MDYATYLVHHGIKGQKWGIRRYQNPDGTLTAAGRKRYYNSDGTMTKYETRARYEANKLMRGRGIEKALLAGREKEVAQIKAAAEKKALELAKNNMEAIRNQDTQGLTEELSAFISKHLSDLTSDITINTPSGRRAVDWLVNVQGMSVDDFIITAIVGKHK